MRPIAHGMDFDVVPDYLCQTNPLFTTQMKILLPPTSNLQAFREIAILMHKMMTIGAVHGLWVIYRKSGTGELPSPVSAYRGDRTVWPVEVKSLTKQHVETLVDNVDPCLRFVDQCLCDMKEKNRRCERELMTKAKVLPEYTRIIEYAMEKFVKEHLQSLSIDIDQQMATVQYQYTDEILQRAYLAENPNDSEVSFFSSCH